MIRNRLIFAVCAVFALLPVIASANVSGICSGCHVMHASQVSTGGGPFTPSDALLIQTCPGCHTEAGGTSIGPAVLDAGTDLAGGDFGSAVADPRMGHNPNEISLADSLTAPPGWKDGFPDTMGNQVANGASWAADTLTCAGKFGCHGDHSETNAVLSMKAAHHNNTDGSVDPAAGNATVGGSYRFLLGIKGYEDSDWEATVGDGDHNVYIGELRTGTGTTGDIISSKQTISYLCAQCHGKFHGGTAANEGLLEDATDTMFTDPWIRHPVDVEMPNTGEYTTYNLDNTYSNSTPVATTTVQTAVSQDGEILAKSNRVIMCLSCHRAHASPYYAAMRWNYRGSAGSWTNGCSICHSNKN